MSATTAFRVTPSCRDFPRWRPPTSTPFAGVFTAESQTGFVRGLQKMWERIRAKADLDDLRLHDLRHHFISVGASSGESLYILGKLAGHRSPETTQHYATWQKTPSATAQTG